ncbi:hypothetical protein [Desulfotomaculum copahuensis]|nr:hypothetical protein [Desulfotomaculum copahuensis]
MSLKVFVRVIEAGTRVTFDMYFNGVKINGNSHLSVPADQFSDLVNRLGAGVGTMGASMMGEPARYMFFGQETGSGYAV